MGESEILNGLYEELRLDQWWHDLLGQKPLFEGFDLDVAIASIPRTEVKAAEAVHEKFKSVLSYTEAANKWFLWDGRIHLPCDGDGIAIKIAKLAYKALCDALDFVKEFIYKQAAVVEASGSGTAKADADKIRASYDKGEVSKHKFFRDRMSSDAGLNALIRTMKTECDVPSNYYDDDQRWFVMRDWVLDLDEVRKGSWAMVAHAPERNVTKFFDANYGTQKTQGKNLGHWDTFLERSVPNQASRDYLQKVVGAAFMGQSKLRTILNLHGPPGSGKSVFINTIFNMAKAGAGYAAMPDSKSIIKVSGQNFDQDSFKGRRFIGVSEPPMGDPIDNEFLKKYTGDVWVETRTLNVKSAGWVPQGVIFVASNKALRINTRDKAIVNRVQLIEFPVEFEDGPGVPEERRSVVGLEDKLKDDSMRVLEWIIAGMRKFVEDGLKLHPPAEVLALQSEVVTDASTALRWADDFIVEGMVEVNYQVADQYFIPVKDAYMAYQNWIVMVGERKPLTLRYFSEDIENKFGASVRVDGILRFKGLSMTPQFRRINEGHGVKAVGF